MDIEVASVEYVAEATTPFREPPAPRFELPKMPYKGLVPFDEVDAPFFFGRDLDRALVSANLTSSRFTILYGASGVGKSSILRAGAIPDLRDLIRENIRALGEPQLVVCGFSTWRDQDLVASVETVVRDKVGQLTGDPLVLDPKLDRLPAVLAAASAAVRGKVLLVLDQFEEYFLYHPSADDAFGRQLADVVNDPGLRTNVLVSIREDGLAMLDRFQGEIPALFDNYLRLEHLEQDGAREAILGPRDKWNQVAPPELAFDVDEDLVRAVLEELQTGRVVLDTLGHGLTDAMTGDDSRIETPYLQLVMTRLWEESRPAKSSRRRLRLETLERLGGSDEIVRTHLDKAMKVLPRFERYIAGRAFHYLVTPSGTKVAHAVGDLAQYADVSQADLRRVFGKLSAPDVRILRRLESVDGAEEDERFEIFHDVLAIAILDWRSRFLRGQRFLEGLKRTLAFMLHLTLFGTWLWAVVAAAHDDAARDAVVAVWIVAGGAVWARATLILFRRWRRRSLWLTPVVATLAASAGPIMLALTIWVWVVRRWRRARALRVEAAAAAVPRRRRALRRLKYRPVAVEPYVMGSALIGMAGAGLLIVGCSVPILHFDEDVGFTLVDYGGWNAAQQLTVAAAIGLVAMVVLVRPLPRLLTASLLFVFGLLALVEFAGWAAFAASDDSWDAAAGMVFGLLGSAVILARPILPERVLDLFAALIGAGEIASGDDSARPRLFERGGERRVRRSVVAAVAVGGLLLVASIFLPVYPDSSSWASDPNWFLAVLTPPIGTACVVLLMLVARPAPLLVAGALLGLGLGALAYFVGIVGAGVTGDSGLASGVYCGLLGAVIVLAVAILELRRSAKPV